MKNRTELEAELEEVEKKIVPTSQQLDDLLKRFAVSVVPEVKGWIKKEAIGQMEEHHAKVNEAGIDFVREFKGDVVALLDSIDEICLIALGPKDQWPHNKEIKQEDFYMSSQNDFFSHVFRRAVSSLGKILDARGLLTGNTQNSSWRRGPSRGYEYAYHSGFDGKKYEEVSTYRELLRTHWELKQSISRMKVSIEKAKTRELWDEV